MVSNPIMADGIQEPIIEQRLGGLATELVVASIFVDEGWNVYLPHRDVGIDFIVTKPNPNGLTIRPVQVKGCYWRSRKDTDCYGKLNMDLSEVHKEMALVMPFYYEGMPARSLECIAFLPFSQLVKKPNGNYRCEPACIMKRRVSPRRDFWQYFGLEGLRLMEQSDWSSLRVR